MACLRFATSVLLFVQIWVLQSTDALKHIDIKLIHFRNFGHQKWIGKECDIGLDPFCEPIFTLCLEEIEQPSSKTTDPLNCVNAITSRKTNGPFNLKDTEDGPIFMEHLDTVSGMPNPLLSSTCREGPVSLKVLVEDYDESLTEGGDEVMDRMFIRLEQTPTYNGTINDWVNLTLVGDRTLATPSQLAIKFRIYCDESHFGADCERYCVDTDDETGHYLCVGDGYKLCLPGWTSPEVNCLLPSDGYSTNGGTSVSEIMLYVMSGLFGVSLIAIAVLACKFHKARLATDGIPTAGHREPKGRMNFAMTEMTAPDLEMFPAAGSSHNPPPYTPTV